MGYAIAYVLGILTGALVPFTVYVYRKNRALQSGEPWRLTPGVPIPLPSPAAGTDEEPVFLTSLGFRAVPTHRRVGRRPFRPGPRGSVVR